MDLSKVRSMTDEELRLYLKSLSDRKTSNCSKCGKQNAGYTINVRNNHKFQQKKLCSLCDECYSDMLDSIGISDIIWD